MNAQAGRFVGGVIVVDNPEDFTEGEEVTILTRTTERMVDVTPEEAKELRRRVAEADKGKLVSHEELMARLNAL